jgi:nucleoside-diphosphate-sugar epimerase
VPTVQPLTVKQLADRFVEVTGSPRAKISAIPYPVLWTTGVFQPLIKELRTTRYQFTKPFVIDASETERTFGLRPRPLADSLRDAAQAVRAGTASPR